MDGLWLWRMWQTINGDLIHKQLLRLNEIPTEKQQTTFKFTIDLNVYEMNDDLY